MKNLNVIQFSLLALLLLTANLASANVVDANSYQALYGDINGDGHNDIYLTPIDTAPVDESESSATNVSGVGSRLDAPHGSAEHQ